MPLPAELLDAYEKADYVVFGEPELVLHVGEANAELDALLEAEGAASAAYVSAANPEGEARSAHENRVAGEALHASLATQGYPCFEGEGRDPRGRWGAEPSVLVVGISREDAQTLGRTLEQNAIVFVEKGRAPELLVLAD